MLDVRRLRLLSELARLGTISAVAKVVGYTPSAVSQSLSLLESEAGVPLLERDGRGVRLTPAARALVTRTERVLEELDAAEAELAAEQGSVRGSIVVGAFPSAASGLVVPALAGLAGDHPELVCTIREHEPEDGIPLLRSGELDLLVSESYDDVEPAPAGGLESRALMSEPLLLVLPAGHPAPDPARLSSFSDSPWIAGLAGTQFAAMLEQVCRAAGFAPRVAHRADDALLHRALAAAGLGVGMLPALACERSAAVRHVGVAGLATRRRVSALMRRGAARRPALVATLAALRGRSETLQRESVSA